MQEGMELIQSEYHALLRSDLYALMVRCFMHLYPDTMFMPNWHLEVMQRSSRIVCQVGNGVLLSMSHRAT
jgi:hypothetical protein